MARPFCYPSLPASIQSISHWWRVCSQRNNEQAVAAAYFAWHMWNEIAHEKWPPPTESSWLLHGYISSLLCLKQYPNGDVVKGKMVINAAPPAHTASALAKEELSWFAPTTGWTKLNTDESFVPATGMAGGGMILRNTQGNIIFSACRELRTCGNVLGAELAACREGLELALHRTTLPISVELDSSEVVSLIIANSDDRSVHRFVIQEIKSLASTEDREISFTLCRRSQNKVSHELAAYGRSTPRTAVWLYSGLDFIVNLVVAERPP